MCCLCFNKYPLSAMSEVDGVKTDVCPNCALQEALQLEVRDLRAKVQFCVDFMDHRGLLEASERCFAFPDGDTWRAGG